MLTKMIRAIPEWILEWLLWSANVATVAGAWWFGWFPTELEGWVRLFTVPTELS
jgi:hypothetical protein